MAFPILILVLLIQSWLCIFITFMLPATDCSLLPLPLKNSSLFVFLSLQEEEERSLLRGGGGASPLRRLDRSKGGYPPHLYFLFFCSFFLMFLLCLQPDPALTCQIRPWPARFSQGGWIQLRGGRIRSWPASSWPSMISPAWTTAIALASQMADSRWAIMKVVRATEGRSTASWTVFSDSASSALVASSSRRIFGDLTNTLARPEPVKGRPYPATRMSPVFGRHRSSWWSSLSS